MIVTTRAGIIFVAWFVVTVALGFAHTVITDTQIVLHSGDYVPRFAVLTSRRLVVPAGAAVVLPAISEFDAIEVAGTLRVSRQYDTVCRFVNLQVLPGGYLDMGSATDPVLRNVEFIVRNRPIDVVNDPYQWGNGIFNLGKWTIYGRPIDRTWSRMFPAGAGARVVMLLNTVDWQVGDELLVPDTRQIKWGPLDGSGVGPWGQVIPIRRESPLSIDRTYRMQTEAASFDRLYLTKPLDFEHLAATSPEGQTRFLPYVANATRNIVIRSENPLGVRGHTVTTGDGSQNLAYAAFVGLGRTLPIPLDNTTIVNGVVHVGLNQVAKYPIHWHHASTSAPDWGSVRGLYVDGTDIAKWGIVVHGTSDVTVEDCVVSRCVGAGIITEDGPEVRNTFERNFAMGCTGQTVDPAQNAKNLIIYLNPGSEGAGFWFHGTMNTIRDNVSCNNVIGINAVHFGSVVYGYPSEPGSDVKTPLNISKETPIDFSNNVCFSNARTGFETWNLFSDGKTGAPWKAVNLDCWHNGEHQITTGVGEGSSFMLDRCHCLATGGITKAISSSAGYTGVIRIENSRIEGCAQGVETVHTYYSLLNTTLHNGLNIDWTIGPNRPWPGPVYGVSVVNCKATPLRHGDPNTVLSEGFVLPGGGLELDGAGYPGDSP